MAAHRRLSSATRSKLLTDANILKMEERNRTISLISHPSKVMLRLILNKLVSHAGQILEEEQVSFRSRRSTTKHIFNLKGLVLVEKHMEHQELFHNFIDFKKAFFDRVWHDDL